MGQLAAESMYPPDDIRLSSSLWHNLAEGWLQDLGVHLRAGGATTSSQDATAFGGVSNGTGKNGTRATRRVRERETDRYIEKERERERGGYSIARRNITVNRGEINNKPGQIYPYKSGGGRWSSPVRVLPFRSRIQCDPRSSTRCGVRKDG